MPFTKQLLYKPVAEKSWDSEFFETMEGVYTKSTELGNNFKLHGKDSQPNYWKFNGNGEVVMGGIYPRMYIMDEFHNTECTFYFKRLSVDGKASDGANIGCRSHPTGHIDSSPVGLANTHTYYGRCRNDGGSDIAKEPHHKKEDEYESTYRTWGNGRYRKKRKIFYGENLPVNQWIGWKFVCMDLKGEEDGVLLQTWIDLKSDGVDEDKNINNWELVESVVDVYGKIPGAPSKAYDIWGTDPKSSFFGKKGIVMLRNGFSDAVYKDIHVQEIRPIKKGCEKLSPKFTYRGNIFKDYLMNLFNIVGYVGNSVLNIIK